MYRFVPYLLYIYSCIEKLCIHIYIERLGYVRNPRSLMEGTETLCRDDIGDLPGSPNHLCKEKTPMNIG